MDPRQLFAFAGEIVDFNRDRIDLDKYSIVSPVADDALEHYTYAILDTLEVDHRHVFRLAVRPASVAEPLFVGMIDIADDTYRVLGIDVGVNRAADFTYLDGLRYRQRLREESGGHWLPYQIALSAEMRLGVPIPGLPRHLGLQYMVLLDDFRFDRGDAPADLRSVRIVVDEHADDADRTGWTMPGPARLTPVERAAWARLDSVARDPAPAKRLARGMARVVVPPAG